MVDFLYYGERFNSYIWVGMAKQNEKLMRMFGVCGKSSACDVIALLDER